LELRASLSPAWPPIFIKVTRTEPSALLGNLDEITERLKVLWWEGLFLQLRDLMESHCCCHCWQRHSESSRKMGGIISCFTCSGYILATIRSSYCNIPQSLSAAGRGSVLAVCSTGQDNVFASQ